MTKEVLFIQGAGAGTHDEWDNKLVDSLSGALGRGYDVRYPRMPNESGPNPVIWKAAITDALAALAEDAVLVGHSIGGAILIDALADAPPKQRFGGVFLIAPPFIGAGGWPSDDIAPMADVGARLPSRMPTYIYHGSEDDTVPSEHVDLYATAIPGAIVRRLPGRDHQLNDNLAEVAADIRAST